MALIGFSHTGTPGDASDGEGVHIRQTLDNNLSADWTVHPLITFGSGGETGDQRDYFVLEHANGPQILVYVAVGDGEGGSQGLDSSWVNSSFSTGTDQTVWVALDKNGGGVGTDSFYDNLNNNGLDPADSNFWNQVEKTQAVRCVEWFEGSGLSTLYFIEDDAACTLIIYSNSSDASRSNSISVVLISEEYVDDSDRPEADKLPTTHGVLAVQADDDGGGNDVEEWESYIFTGVGDYSLNGGLNNIDTSFWLLGSNSASTEPDLDGRYATQTIPVYGFDDGNSNPQLIRGVINPVLARFTPPAGVPLGIRRDGGELMPGPAQMAFGWSNGLGDIL